MKKENKCIIIFNNGDYKYFYGSKKGLQNLIDNKIIIGFFDNLDKLRDLNDVKYIIEL